jgi:hypothetical protein
MAVLQVLLLLDVGVLLLRTSSAAPLPLLCSSRAPAA